MNACVHGVNVKESASEDLNHNIQMTAMHVKMPADKRVNRKSQRGQVTYANITL